MKKSQSAFVESILDDLEDMRSEQQEGIPSYEILVEDKEQYTVIEQYDRHIPSEHIPEKMYKEMGLAK